MNNTKKIVIDAGHGGEDPGAIGNGIVEKDLTLKISNYIADRLKELGVSVIMTRNSDETLTPTERVNRVINAFGDSSDVIVISNHINSGGGDGAEAIYALRNDNALPNLILSELEKEGQNIRKSYQRRLPSNPSKDYYFMHRNTGNTQLIIIEYGFLDSKNDDVNQLKNNWNNYAEAVVRAIIEYLNLTYIPIQNDAYYTVQKGDTLWNIAKKFNTTVDEIKKNNNLANTLLSIGQKIFIGDNYNSYNIYTVKKGDTLYKIAKSFNIDVNELIKLNNLTNSIISIDQKLKIPKIDNIYYTVQKGDTLWSIAKKFNTNVNNIIEANKLINNTLSIGEKLKIK